MKKSDKQRGRPIVVKPWMESLIADRIMCEKRKSAEQRTQRNILATEIRDEIDTKKSKDERTPREGTIEKLITAYYKRASPEDKPWTIFTLNEYPIPPEVLPRVLEEHRRIKLVAEQLGDEEVASVPYLFTIRHAKWVARLSALKAPEALGLYYRILADAEQLSELTGHPPDYGLFEEALAASEANDLEREAVAMEHFADWSTSELIRLLGPQGQRLMEKFREVEERKLKKLREEEERE